MKDYHHDKCVCGGLKRTTAERCTNCRLLRSVKNQDMVLKHMALGLSRRQVAKVLSLSYGALDGYWRKIVARFGTKSQFRVALLAERAGMFKTK